MTLLRRRFLQLGGAAIAAAAGSQVAEAQVYPVRPVRILVGFSPGGLTDITARSISQKLSAQFGQQFVVENRPGAATNIATEAAIRAPADGYTLLLATVSNAINASIYRKLNFDFLRDTTPIARLVDAVPVMEVHPSVPAKTVAEFIAYAKANPGKITYASSGYGSLSHVSAELFKMRTGVTMLHVPYRGSTSALTDLIAGQVQVFFDLIASSVGYIKAGRLRALAIATATRSAALPGIPSLAESLPGFSVSGWEGLVAPKGTPPPVIDRLNRESNAALADPALVARFGALGASVLPGSPADFGRHIAEDTEKWAKVSRLLDIKAD